MTEIISVHFRSGSKNYYFDPRGLQVSPGDYVIVETAQGLAYAQCMEGNREVPEQSVVQPLRPVVRLATEQDHKTEEWCKKREKEVFTLCEQRIAAHRLKMKLIAAECSFEGTKITFFFTADGRVDFRELVKDLAGLLRSRIELRQIGVRDEAKMLGGLGICGRPLCCSQFLDDFVPVSIKMVKTQNVSLNPSKTSGCCGRLMCCFKYEQAAYEEAAARLPKNDSFVDTPDGIGNVCAVDLLRETVTVKLDSAPEEPKKYRADEVVVLRSGKGSREGIEIPAQRPRRTSEEEGGAEPFKRRNAFSKTLPPLPPEEDAGEPVREEAPPREPNQSSRRGGGSERPRRERPQKAANAARGEKPVKPPQPEAMPTPVHVASSASSVTAAKKAAADRAAQGQGAGKPGEGKRPPNRHRTFRRPNKG